MKAGLAENCVDMKITNSNVSTKFKILMTSQLLYIYIYIYTKHTIPHCL